MTWASLCVGLAAATSLVAHDNVPAAAGEFQSLATLHVKPAQLSDFLQALQANAQATRTENGNISFSVFQSEADPDPLYVREQGKDLSTYQAHLQQPLLLAMHARAKVDLQGAIERT